MKLVLYGGGGEDENEDLDLASIELSEKRSPKVTYIPACSYDSYRDFQAFARQFSKYGVTRLMYFPVDIPYDEVLYREAFKADIIHLSGGNTFYFLNTLRKKRLMRPLRTFAQKGGVLTGLSAGGIMMTPSIHTASFPSFDRDDNEENLSNWKALNLLKFEFFPHYRNSKRYEECLKKESSRRSTPIFACPDGHGIVVDDDSLQFCGRAFAFRQGTKITLSS